MLRKSFTDKRKSPLSFKRYMAVAQVEEKTWRGTFLGEGPAQVWRQENTQNLKNYKQL